MEYKLGYYGHDYDDNYKVDYSFIDKDYEQRIENTRNSIIQWLQEKELTDIIESLLKVNSNALIKWKMCIEVALNAKENENENQEI